MLSNQLNSFSVTEIRVLPQNRIVEIYLSLPKQFAPESIPKSLKDGIFTLDVNNLQILRSVNEGKWFTSKELEEACRLSRSATLKRAEVLTEIGFLQKEVAPGTENRHKPPYQYTAGNLLKAINAENLLKAINAGETENAIPPNFSEFPYSPEETNNSEVNVAAGLKAEETTLLPLKQDIDTALQNEASQQIIEDDETQKLIEIGKSSMLHKTITLDQIWSTLQEVSKVFMDKITEQNNRISELEEMLKISTTTDTDPQEFLNDIRSKLKRISVDENNETEV
ncbi:hypothetical protein [Pseudanabaena sp. UWO310]|uniref:hypothetical protein n=1 Tax=Pseudanabaena sp. UWO310 TaxID=2480795 RepID=UPI001159AF65|nr:hypothetical protein [Pseudanabaena sp. UWO310]TYQ29842.1 hypothetical protein PseudUWO310_11610 [Pseudanabaena sp. UWO310]